MEEEHPIRFLWSYGRHRFVDRDPSLVSPLPYAIHIFSRPVAATEGIRDMAITTMSVSLASIIRYLYPSMAACRPCTNIRVSASSWEHGATSSRLTLVSLVVVMAFSPLVMVTGLPVVISDTVSARKWNSSVLLVLSLRKLCQFEEVLLVAVTLLLMAFPRLHLASAFRLDL